MPFGVVWLDYRRSWHSLAVAPYSRLVSDLILYELQGYPYCVKVKDKLSDLNLEYESRMVPSTHAEHREVEEVGGQIGIPVPVDEEHSVEGVPESNDIVDYFEETYGSVV